MLQLIFAAACLLPLSPVHAGVAVGIDEQGMWFSADCERYWIDVTFGKTLEVETGGPTDPRAL